MVEGVFIGHVASFRDLVELRVEDVGGLGGVAVFFASENQNLSLGDWTGPKPVLYVVFKTLRPDFN